MVAYYFSFKTALVKGSPNVVSPNASVLIYDVLDVNRATPVNAYSDAGLTSIVNLVSDAYGIVPDFYTDNRPDILWKSGTFKGQWATSQSRPGLRGATGPEGPQGIQGVQGNPGLNGAGTNAEVAAYIPSTGPTRDALDARYAQTNSVDSLVAEKIVSGGATADALNAKYVARAERGVANGVATLDGAGRIPVSQMPPTASLKTITNLPTSGLWSAHRGGGWPHPVMPEGTLESYERAIAMGASIIDIDYKTTQDGVMVCMHDQTVDRTTVGTGDISTFQSQNLPNIAGARMSGAGWGNSERVPTIEQIFTRLGGKVVFTIEAKDGTPSVAPLAALIKKYNLVDSVFINTGDVTVAQTITNAGIASHVYNVQDATKLNACVAAGVDLIEVWNPTNTAFVTQALASGIPRVIAGPTYRRDVLASHDPRLHGYVNDAIGYLDKKTKYTNSIAASAQSQKVSSGWFSATLLGAENQTMGDMLTNGGVKLIQDQMVFLGDLSGGPSDPMPGTYSIIATVKGSSAASASGLGHFDVKVCSLKDNPFWNGSAANGVGGYTCAVRWNGQLNIWRDNVDGTTTLLGSGASTADLNSDSKVFKIIIDVTPTGISLSRYDGGARTNTITFADATFRGPYIAMAYTKSSDATSAAAFTATSIVRV